MTDLLIVGGGPVGCVVAEHAARLKNWNSVIVEKETTLQVTVLILTTKMNSSFINMDLIISEQMMKKKIINYLSNFTEWIEGNYIVKTSYQNKLYPFQSIWILWKSFTVKNFRKIVLRIY